MPMRLALLVLALSACSPPPEPDAGRDVSRIDTVLPDTQEPDVRDVQTRDVSMPDVRDAQAVDVSCGDGGTACSGVCVDLTRDETNCGACGVTCGTGMAHQNIACIPFADGPRCGGGCSPGFGDCNGDGLGNDADGCESPLNTQFRCGNCARQCSGATPRCVAGQCQA